MIKTASWAVAMCAVVAFGMAGCADPQEVSDIKAKVDEIQAQQKDILTKLDNVKAAPARPTPQRPRGPDPSKVYAFPVGESPVQGSNDAWVTIVEVSDFQ